MAVELAVRWGCQTPEANHEKHFARIAIDLADAERLRRLIAGRQRRDRKRLYDANCIECHDTSVFTRKDRVVESLDALEKQLASCTHMAKKEFSASETHDLLRYLNDQFYHFR